jgi:hypothetical protein
MGFRIAPAMTALAFDGRIRAMKLHQAIGSCASEAMQSVNVLRDDAADFAGLLQPDDGVVHRIRSCAQKSFPSLQFVIPMFDAGRFRSHEILEVNWLPPCPDTPGAAKIGDSAPGRDSSASENDCTARLAQVLGQIHIVTILYANPSARGA